MHFHNVSLKAPITVQPGEDDLLVMTICGMAAMGVAGAVAMFVISNQKLKRDENKGRTGMDPAHLRAYSTSSSAGWYKTNRGESHLTFPEKSRMPIQWNEK